MFITDQGMITDSHLDNKLVKLIVHNEEGGLYSFDAPLDMSVSCLKTLVVHQFFSRLLSCPRESSARTSGERYDRSQKEYRFLLVRDCRPLLDENSVFSESLKDNDELLLVQCEGDSKSNSLIPSFENGENCLNFLPEGSVPSSDQIERETALLTPSEPMKPIVSPSSCAYDFKIALKQILLAMIEASIYIITPEPNASEIFRSIFDHLEKRHKPKVDKASLQQLTDMGFSEEKAIQALQLKKKVQEATEWLLEEAGGNDSSACNFESESVSSHSSDRDDFNSSVKTDLANSVLKKFQKYVEKWFKPDARALQNLIGLGYGSDLAKEALRISCNSESHAKEFLEGHSSLVENYLKGFQRDSPIMSAIFDSSIVQAALAKPKTLFALMVLCETPSNVNVWLSDPETHPVVSQVLRIYHAEKHRLVDEVEQEHLMEQQSLPLEGSRSSDSIEANTSIITGLYNREPCNNNIDYTMRDSLVSNSQNLSTNNSNFSGNLELDTVRISRDELRLDISSSLNDRSHGIDYSNVDFSTEDDVDMTDNDIYEVSLGGQDLLD